MSGVAVADDISNSLDASVDVVAETMPLNVGGAGTTTLYVIPANGDGKQGCNLTGDTKLRVSVASSNTAVATVSPASAEFTSCGDIKQLSVQAVAAGAATITVSETFNNTGATFNFAPATFTVNVTAPAPANTAPGIVVDGVDPGAEYEKGAVPAATCKVTDAEDGNKNFAADLSTDLLDSDGLGSQTASCSYTDGGGLTASVSKTYSIVDNSAPVIGYTISPASPDGANSWYRGTVTVDWTVTEDESPNSLTTVGCDDVTISADQFGRTYTCSAESSGGDTSVTTTESIKRDGTGPSVSYTSAAGTVGDGGWYKSPVTATFSATDGFSGPATQTGTTSSDSDGEAVVLGSPEFFDLAGNKTAAGDKTSPAFKIDTVAPDAPTFVGGPAAGSSFYFGSDIPAAPTCASNDATSKLASCVVSGYSTAVGTHTMTATATDNAGHTSTAQRTYTVLAWTLSGFYSPVDMGGVVNTVKGGSTVPLKFEMFSGSTELTSLSDIKSFTTAKVNCGSLSTALTDEIEVLSTGGTSLRYDTTGGQFIQNWKTPTGAGVCYRATMTAQDGSSLGAYFKTK